MGMIRVSEDAEKQIKEMAEGKTITATVDALLARNDIAARMDKMASYLEKKLNDIKDEIISSIKDTTIDRLDSRPRGGGGRISLDWPLVQELIFDVAKPEDFVSKGLYTGVHESNILDEIDWFIENGQVWGDLHGSKLPYLNLTPNISSFLASKGVVWE